MTRHAWRDPHMLRARRSLVKALVYAVGFFLLLFVCQHIAGALRASWLSETSIEAFRGGIAADLSYLKEQGDAVAKNESVIKHLLARNTDSLLEVLQEEKANRFIGLMGVADAEGVVVSRTRTTGKLGDNVFLLNSIGRVVAQGQSAESVEAPVGFDPRQIFLTTGRPIINEGRMIGGLFANYLADDVYASRFRDAYLPKGVEVVFYNKAGGTYGDSFSDPEVHRLINSYFNSGSEWIQDGASGKTISFGDGKFYLVENEVFPGLEQSPGGALLFIPRQDISGWLNFVTAFLTLCVFLFFAMRHHVRSTAEERGWRYYLLLGLFSAPIILLAVFVLNLQNTGYLKLGRIAYPLYNSTMRLQPEFGIFDVDFEQRFSIMVDTGDEGVNVVQAEIDFDPAALEVKALDTANSICSYVIENKIDAIAGKASLTCAILQSGGNRGSLNIADVLAVPRRAGAFTLSFNQAETKVLASDGLGTDVLRMSQASTYLAADFDPTSPSNASGGTVFSPTHPNLSRWYNSPTARFVWKGDPKSVYAYEFDASPDTVPAATRTIQGTSVDINIPGDGVFYFHLRPVAGGTVTHYRLQSDRTPPAIAAMHFTADKIVAGDVVRFSFQAEDPGSGIQKNYYVDLGNHLFLPIGSQLFVPFLEPGNQGLTLRVYDSAGNYSEKTQVVHVEPK